MALGLSGFPRPRRVEAVQQIGPIASVLVVLDQQRFAFDPEGLADAAVNDAPGAVVGAAARPSGA